MYVGHLDFYAERNSMQELLTNKATCQHDDQCLILHYEN